MTILYRVVQAENEIAAKMPDQITVAVFYLEDTAHSFAANCQFWFVVPFKADYKLWLNITDTLNG